MTSATRFAFAVLAAALLGCTDDDVTGPGDDFAPVDPASYSPTMWTAAHVNNIALSPDNTMPLYVPPENVFSPGLYIWDAWPVRTRNGSIARLNGQYIMIALTAVDSVAPGQRTPLSQLRYFLSSDGSTWRPAGLLFGTSSPEGRAQWAGSAMYDEESGNLYSFYTATSGTPVTDLGGVDSAGNPLRTIQKLAVGVARVTAVDSGFAFGTWSHRIIGEPDGRYYELPENADTVGVVYGFRDPFFYRDPADGRDYVLFTANAAGSDTTSGFNRQYNGVVGVLQARTSSLQSWEKLPPLFAAPGVNEQLERPHIINTNGLYYVFWSTHNFTFGPGLTGYEGLYGFAGESLFAQKQPLNGSGLVLANPPVAASQSYSFLALPSGQGRAQVISFLNTVGDRSYVTFAPPVGIALDGLNTRITAANAGPDFSFFSLQGVTAQPATVRIPVPSVLR